jgi:outer membrane protein
MNKWGVSLIIVALVLSGVSFYRSFNHVKTAYVRSAELVYSFDGMKESQQLFKGKKERTQSNVDTLKIELERAYNAYVKKSGSLSEKQKKEHQQLLERQQQNYLQYAQAISEKEQKEETEMTQAVLNQINSFVEQYAKEKGYDIVFGTTNSGNILYAKESLDITKEVLKALNENYRSVEKNEDVKE